MIHLSLNAANIVGHLAFDTRHRDHRHFFGVSISAVCTYDHVFVMRANVMVCVFAIKEWKGLGCVGVCVCFGEVSVCVRLGSCVFTCTCVVKESD